MSRPYRPSDLDDLLICGNCTGFADTADRPAEIVVRGPRLMWLCGHCDELCAVEVPAEYRRFVAAVSNDRIDDETVLDLAVTLGVHNRFENALAELRAGRL